MQSTTPTEGEEARYDRNDFETVKMTEGCYQLS